MIDYSKSLETAAQVIHVSRANHNAERFFNNRHYNQDSGPTTHSKRRSDHNHIHHKMITTINSPKQTKPVNAGCHGRGTYRLRDGPRFVQPRSASNQLDTKVRSKERPKCHDEASPSTSCRRKQTIRISSMPSEKLNNLFSRLAATDDGDLQ